MQLNVKYRVDSILITMKFRNQFLPINAAAVIAVIIFCSVGLAAQDRAKRPREESLLNRLKVLMWNDPAARSVSIKLRIHSGSAFDPQGKEGVMRLLADNIFPTGDARDYFAEDLGGSLRVETTYDYIQIDAVSSPDKLLEMIDTLAAAVISPTIDKPTTAALRDALIAELKPLESDTAYVADRAAAQRMFGTFPYGRPRYGSVESVKKIDFPDLIDAKVRFLAADNATMTVVGNFNPSRAWQSIRRSFGPWLKSDRRVPSTFRQPDAPPNERSNIASPNANESAIRFAMRSVARGDADFIPTRVFAAVLEQRLAARMPEAVADKAFVRLDEHVLPGALTVGFSAARNDIGTANGRFAAGDLFEKILAEPVTEAEFSAAKSLVISEWRSRDTALLWLDAHTYKTSGAAAETAALERLSLADVQAAAAKLRNADKVSVLVNSPRQPTR